MMHHPPSCALLISTIPFIVSSTALAAPATQPSPFDPARHMRVDEVKPGMKGYGLTVFSGRAIERFELNVIAVQKNFGPKEDVVLIRCLGERLEHTGVIAGMSGSPIFLIDDAGRERMVGALAYGWTLSKDPIAGVQPIEYMLDLPTDPPAPLPTTTAATAPTTRTAAAERGGVVRWPIEQVVMLPGMNAPPPGYPLASWDRFAPNPNLTRGASVGAGAQLIPMATPLMVGGLPPDVLRAVAPVLSAYGLVPLQSGGGGAPATRDGEPSSITPGSALVVPLVTGDLDMTALGTCTEVRGDRVYGFGHPFNNEGPVALPMGAGYVTTVIPTLMTSFKLGGMTDVLGTLSADQSVGIAGRLGAAPAMIPVDVRVAYADGSSDRAFHFDVAAHPQFTPLLGTMVIATSLSAQRMLPQHHTLDTDLTIEFRNGRSLRVANTSVNTSPAEVFYDVGTPMIAASENPFERVLVKRVSGTITVTPEARAAQILDVNVPRTRYRPGETVKAYVTYRPFRGSEAIQAVEMPVPADLPDGTYTLSISDWQTYLQQEREAEPFRFTTENVDQVFEVLKELADVRRNALYVRLMRQPDGVAVGRTAMPRLPSSRREVLLGAGRSNTTAFVSSSVKVVPARYVFTGETEFSIEIDRNAGTERPRKHDAEGRPSKPPAKPTSAPAG